MNFGKILFTQVMSYVPWKTLGRIIDRYNGDAGVRTLDCADVFRIMAFSQLTWRESLRDIEICLTANQRKLAHMGIKNVPSRSTLSDALNGRSWQIYHDLAMNLISRARKLYENEVTALENLVHFMLWIVDTLIMQGYIVLNKLEHFLLLEQNVV